MHPVTIPKQLAAKDDLVIIPRKEYDTLLICAGFHKTFIPTAAEKRALTRAERNLREKKTLSYHELRRSLGFTS